MECDRKKEKQEDQKNIFQIQKLDVIMSHKEVKDQQPPTRATFFNTD